MNACSQCDYRSPKWFGRCPSCGAWDSATIPAASASAPVLATTTLAASPAEPARIPTGIGECDRVLGGGFVSGQVALLAGEPGIGKSTLVLQMLDGLAAAGLKVLLVSGEESVPQIARRAARLGVAGAVEIAQATSLAAIDGAIQADIDVVVVDSIQTIEDTSLDPIAGSPVQVRACAAGLVARAKATGTVVLLVGHVTKDGAVAGPKTLEHVVDSVLTLEGERGGELRVLRAVKNRFGPCDDTGVFAMTGAGLEGVADPSALLLQDRRPGRAGSIVFPALDGRRPLLIEVQALLSETELPQPRRVAIGLDPKRLALLLAVLGAETGEKPGKLDVYVAAAGGLTVREPAADLATCIALVSAARGVPTDPHLIAVGEVGLAGEIRRVPGIERRLAEAARHGFTHALVPRGTPVVTGIETIEVGELPAALTAGVPARLTAVGQ